MEHLSSFAGLHVTVASNDIDAAEEIVKGTTRTDATELDVADEKSLRKLMRSHDVVVSLLPPPFHVQIAKLCIEERRHLVTTSYVSPEVRTTKRWRR